MKRFINSAIVLTLWLSVASRLEAQATAKATFLSWEQAQPAVQALAGQLPPGLSAHHPVTPEDWDHWVTTEDTAIRARLDRGEEDTMTNLLRFGVTFTKEYRIDDAYLLKYGQSTLVNAFAENRANDLIRAMTSLNPGERLSQMRAFLERQGYSFKTPEDQKKIKAYLLANLARMRDDILRYTSESQRANPYQMFQDRGISLDTNLWPDFLIDQHLEKLVEKGLLKPGTIRRVVIVGPGLDFANKENGSDFYPLQTIQPFAVLDSLTRLGLSDPSSVEIYTLDISSDVNYHMERARKLAESGKSYTLQLPWDTAARQTPEYRTAFIQYWERLGSSIGEPVAAIPVPAAVAATTKTRAVKLPPKIVERLIPLDTNIIFQHLATEPNAAFDLIIGTNVFLYFSSFEQSLARINMALMLKPGGLVLSNGELPGSHGDGLSDSLTTSQVLARDPDRVDYMFTYVRTE